MIAMAIDANSQLFPHAFAIVEGESNDTWSWFLDCIKKYITKRDGLCVISYRHKGILHAMNGVGKGGKSNMHSIDFVNDILFPMFKRSSRM